MQKSVCGLLLLLVILAAAPTTAVRPQVLANGDLQLKSNGDLSKLFPKVPGCDLSVEQLITYDDGYGQVGRYRKSSVTADGVIDTVFVNDDPDFHDCGNVSFRIWLPNKTPVKPANDEKKTAKEMHREKNRSERQAKKSAKLVSLLGRDGVPPPAKTPITVKDFSGSISTWFPRGECGPLTLEQMRPTTTVELWVTANMQVALSLRTDADQAKVIAESIDFEKLIASSDRLPSDWDQ